MVGLVEAVGLQRFCQHVEHRKPRVQRGDGVLEHHLQIAAQRSPAASVQRRDVGAEHFDGTRLRRGQVQDLVQRGRLARARFADDAQRAALLQFEADAVDRPHLADLAAEHHALGQRVGLDQVADAQHDGFVDAGVGGPRRCGGHAVDLGRAATRDVVGAGCRRPGGRARPMPVPVRRCGTRRWPAGSAGANGQPGGSAASDGGAPGIGTRRAPWGASRRGTEPEQSCGVGHSAVAVQVGDRRRLDRPAGVHHQRAVGELGDHPEVVGDDQHAGAGDVARGPQHVEDLRLHGDVQRGRRLVADQQVGVVGDRDRDDDALTLAAGQFVRERPGPPLRLGDADEFEQLDRAGAGGPPADVAAMDLDRLGDLVADGVDRGQRRHRVLEHGPDRVAADARHLLVGQPEQFVAVQPHRAGHLGVLGQQPDDGHGASPTCPHRTRRPARRLRRTST